MFELLCFCKERVRKAGRVLAMKHKSSASKGKMVVKMGENGTFIYIYRLLSYTFNTNSEFVTNLRMKHRAQPLLPPCV